jgi:hypothetical protein
MPPTNLPTNDSLMQVDCDGRSQKILDSNPNNSFGIGDSHRQSWTMVELGATDTPSANRRIFISYYQYDSMALFS